MRQVLRAFALGFCWTSAAVAAAGTLMAVLSYEAAQVDDVSRTAG